MLPVVAKAETVTIKASGTCGDSAYWKLTSDGTLTIYGSGAMFDYAMTSSGTTNPFGTSFTKLVIEEGITHIGSYSFYQKARGSSTDYPVTNCQSVSLPSSLKSIGPGAFYKFSCGVELPSGLSSIGDSAFYQYKGSSVIIPDSVASIGSNAFAYGYLESVVIGSGLTSIGSSVFQNCTLLSSVTVNAASPPVAGSGLFQNCPDALRIYVLDVAAYESAKGWSDYAAWIVGGYTSGGGAGDAGGSTGGTITDGSNTYHLLVYHDVLYDYYLDTDLQFWVVWEAYQGSSTQINRGVTWSVDGLSNETYIDSDGLLHIGEHETRQYLNIFAYSVAYPSLWASSTIKLTHMTEEEANTPTIAPTEDNSAVLDAIDDLQQDVQQVQDSVDTLVEGDENSAAVSSNLGDASQEMQDNMGEVDDFQQSQMDILDDNMDKLEDSVDFSGFIPALEFIMSQVNNIFDGLGDFSVVLTLPLYLGLFFYICSRVPGGTVPKVRRLSRSQGDNT